MQLVGTTIPIKNEMPKKREAFSNHRKINNHNTICYAHIPLKDFVKLKQLTTKIYKCTVFDFICLQP